MLHCVRDGRPWFCQASPARFSSPPGRDVGVSSAPLVVCSCSPDSSGRVLREGPQGGWPPLSCVGRVTAASDRGRCGARTAGTGLRTRAVHLCLRRVCPGTTAELSTRGALGVRLRVPAPAAHSAHPANTKHLRLPRTRHASLSGDEPQSVALGNTIPVILPEDAVVGPVTGPHRC